MTLVLAKRPAASNYELLDLTHLMPDFRRSSRAVGGYWQGTGTIRGPARIDLQDYYNNWIGRQIIEYAYGFECWRGLITELRLTLDGVEHFVSLDAEWFHNYTTVYYSSDIGERDTEGPYQDTISQGIYGKREHNVYLGGATQAGAQALGTRHDNEFSWPRSRMAGGYVFGSDRTRGQDGLQVIVSGFWHTLNWRHKTESETQEADDHVADAITASEFISTGRVDTNTLSVKVGADPNPIPWGDLLEEIVLQGDASGNLWKCGVYEARKLYYEAYPTGISYYLQHNRLYDASGAPASLELVKPGFKLRNVDAIATWLNATGATLDESSVAYVDTVSYDHGNQTLTLSFPGTTPGLLTIEAQIQAGAI
jgi:hypothetical protein